MTEELAAKHVQIARLFSRCGKFHKAENHFRKAYALLPKSEATIFALATFLQETGSYKEAEELLYAAISASAFCKLLLRQTTSSDCIFGDICSLLSQRLLSKFDALPICNSNISECCCAFCIGPLVNLAALQLGIQAQLRSHVKVLKCKSKGSDDIKHEHTSRYHQNVLKGLDLLNSLANLNYLAPEVILNRSIAMRAAGMRQAAIDAVVNHIQIKGNYSDQFSRWPSTRLGITSGFTKIDRLTICCVKWGLKYSVEYVLQLFSSVSHNTHFPNCSSYHHHESRSTTQDISHLNESSDHNNFLHSEGFWSASAKITPDCQCSKGIRFICFTDSIKGLPLNTTGFEVFDISKRCPEHLRGWWTKAFLFSREASTIIFDRNETTLAIYLDLDTLICGNLIELIVDFVGEESLTHIVKNVGWIMSTLSTNNIYCEPIAGGINSSVIAWTSPTFIEGCDEVNDQTKLAIFSEASPLVVRFVHRFDYWLEMLFNVESAAFLDKSGTLVRDYRTLLVESGDPLHTRRWSYEKEPHEAVKFQGDHAAVQPIDDKVSHMQIPPKCVLIIFPGRPKPHEVLKYHPQLMEKFEALCKIGQLSA